MRVNLPSVRGSEVGAFSRYRRSGSPGGYLRGVSLVVSPALLFDEQICELIQFAQPKVRSWMSRLKNAYEFAQKFVDHLDAPEAQRIAAKEFSTLEEISKTT